MFHHLINRVVYYPMPYPDGDWNLQTEAGAQDVWLTTSDGIRLNAWWCPKRSSRFATLFLHGNAGNVTHRIDHARAINAAGLAVLLVDYRGYGKSKGHPSEAGLGLDAEAAYESLTQLGFKRTQIILHGESLGSAVAVKLASARPCAGLILESPFASLGEMAGKVLPIVGPLVVHGFNSKHSITQVHTPVLVIHGDADEVVPFAQVEAVFGAANPPKQFWRIPGAHHNDLLYVAGEQYVPKLRAFYESLR
jgi:hypothetical protein